MQDYVIHLEAQQSVGRYDQESLRQGAAMPLLLSP